MINAAYILEDLGKDNGFCMTIAVTNFRAKHKIYLTFGVSYKQKIAPLIIVPLRPLHSDFGWVCVPSAHRSLGRKCSG